MRVDETYGVLLTLHDWQMAGLSYSLYEKDRQRGHLSTTGRACQGREVEIVYDKLRDDRKRVIDAVFGNTIERMSDQPALVEHIRPDAKARDFFNSYRPEGDASRYVKRIKEYTNDAILLNAMHDLYNERSAYRRACNGKAPSKEAFFLEQIAALGHPDIAESYPNTLPTSVRRLKNKYDTYLKEGYGSLISAKFANDNARKVTEKIERLLVALYSMPNKPFCSSVKDLYDMFLTGKITVFDKETGEVFQPEDFRRNGEPVELSESTIWNYLNQAVNRAVADTRRNDGLYYNNLHRPHHHRKSPQYSFSKISMDDRDLPRLLVGGGRVKAYYAYDVVSGAVVGYFTNLFPDNPPTFVVMEADTAACLYKGALAGDGDPRIVDGDMPTIMAGLACGEPNTLGWDILRNHVSVFVSCPNWVAAKGMRVLGAPQKGDPRVISGESGAVGAGLVPTLMESDEYAELREAIGLDETSSVLLFSTEGDTDPVNYRKVVWDGAYPAE